MDSYSGRYLETLANRDRLFLLKADVQLWRDQCILINTVPFKVRNSEVRKEGLLVQVRPIGDAS